MKRFKPGQEVVCVDDNWTFLNTNNKAPGPKKDEIVTVVDYGSSDHYIVILEYMTKAPNGLFFEYLEQAFEPVINITELVEILEEDPQTISI